MSIKDILKINKVNTLKSELESEILKYKKLNQELKYKIQDLSKSNPELVNAYLDDFLVESKSDLAQEFNQQLEEQKKLYQKKAADILMDAFASIDLNNFKEDYIFKTVCKNVETKSRLIGLNGRNKKAFEKTVGLELIVSQSSDDIIISSPNLIKKEIAKRVLLRLLQTKNIEPNKITNYYQEELAKFDQEMINLGSEIVEIDLGLKDIPKEIYGYVGRMKYRNSYGQNLLSHCLECAYLAETLALKLEIDQKLAKACAFFHDIGKCVNHQSDKDHVELGIEIAQKYKMHPEIIHAIESHHGAVHTKSIYAALVKIVDQLSASRIGARNNSIDNFYDRVKIYEEICYKFPEVKECWVLSTGFLIKVIVKPHLVKDEELSLLGYRIKKAFEMNPETSSYNLTIELIKENTFKIKTEKTYND